MWRAALSKHEYINLILLQYQPLDILDENISKIELLLKKNQGKTTGWIEKFKKKYFNTALIVDPKGNIIKKYHKKNIPSEICYEESYYFDKSNNGYQFFSVGVFKIGILICWDQWHSSTYLELKKKDVNLIICPTAIGTCFHKNKKIQITNEKKKWINVIEANSLMNNIPVVVANRIGTEQQKDSSIKFWGSSFITDAHGTSLKRCKSKQDIIKYRFYKKEQISIKKMWNFQDIS